MHANISIGRDSFVRRREFRLGIYAETGHPDARMSWVADFDEAVFDTAADEAELRETICRTGRLPVDAFSPFCDGELGDPNRATPATTSMWRRRYWGKRAKSPTDKRTRSRIFRRYLPELIASEDFEDYRRFGIHEIRKRMPLSAKLTPQWLAALNAVLCGQEKNLQRIFEVIAEIRKLEAGVTPNASDVRNFANSDVPDLGTADRPHVDTR